MAASAGIAAAQGLALPVRAAARLDPSVWAEPIHLPLGDARAEIRFAEGANCFNLNSLAVRRDNRGGPPEAGRAGAADFARLLRAAGVPLMEAEAVARTTAAVIGGRGALLADPTEWLETPGVSAQMFARVRPLLCTLPNRESAPINVNRIRREELPLLAGLGFDAGRAAEALASRPAGGWSSVSTFWQAMGSSEAESEAVAGAGMSSRYVVVDVIGRAGGAEAHRRVILDASAQPARVVASEWRAPPVPAQGPGA
jgi:general secretion pathway protein K